MCLTQPTEYVICQIADYNPLLRSRNALIRRKMNIRRTAFVNIQPIIGQDGIVAVFLCNESFEVRNDSPFDCDLPENKSIQELAAGDILTARHF